jgi:hypothetical protein
MQLDRLPLEAQRVLEAAAIVGPEFSTNLVAGALELSVEQVDDICDSLVRRSLFIHAEPEGRYGVNHALVQEVCSERSSPARRQRWHRLVAETLERDPRAGEVSHWLAQHFDAAGDAERAIPAYATAARHAAQRYATSDTVALCSRALDLLPRLAPGPARDLLEFQILEIMCDQVSSNSFKATFAGREPLTVYARAIEIARTLADTPKVYAALTQLSSYHMITAQYAKAAALNPELERIEATHDLDPMLLHAGIFARAYTAFFSGELTTARILLERLVPSEGEASVFHDNLGGRALALGHLACVRFVIGEPDRALEEALATIALAERAKIPILVALAHVPASRFFADRRARGAARRARGGF